MIREKIFRLHRHKSSFSGQKFDFTFSNIQLLQVPKGWDKLSVSLISSESGKTLRKSAKVSAKNGTCKWTETLSESIWISDVNGSKEMEEHLTKFLVAMGSSRSSVLGETTLNLAAFLSSESSILVPLPLKKCNYGTILQVEVKCLTPKANLREEKWKGMHTCKDDSADHDNIENLSEVSDCTIAKSAEAHPHEPCSREMSFSASISRYSFDSNDDSVGRHSFGRQDSIESNDSASYCSYSTHGSIKSARSLHGRNQSEDFRKLPPSLQQNSGSSKSSVDPKVQELQAEARMWEQNARKLAIDLETLRKELSDQDLNVTNLNIELGTSHSECQKLSREIEHLKSLLEESLTKQNIIQNSEIQEKLRSDIQKEFEDEIRFQKELNEDLSLQIHKTQESNIGLLSILQEMEETIEKQKIEIESLSVNSITNEVHVEKSNTLHDSVTDNDEKLPEEDDYSLQLKLLNLQSEILVLESTLEDKIIETDIEQDVKNQILKEYIAEFNHRLSENERKILKLEAELSTAFKEDGTRLTDKHLTQLEEENIYLLNRVCGLEAQARYLNDTTESSRLELQHSKSQISRLEEEIESQKLETTNKLLEMEKRFLEADEECKSLSRLNIRLEATTESVVEEYSLLQKLNAMLIEQKLKLQKQHLLHQKAEEESETYEPELETRASEFEKLQLSEENSVLRMQLQGVPELQNEVLGLRVSLKELKSENKLLEATFKSLSADYEELKREKVEMVEKVSDMKKAVLEAEDYRCKKNALEEKILRLEGDLIAKDALFVEEAETKSKLYQMKIANGQLMMTVKNLENLREELWTRVQCLEGELKQTTCAEECFRNPDNTHQSNHSKDLSKRDNDPWGSQVLEMDYESRIQLLEGKLVEALKANDVYKSQLESADQVVASKISEPAKIINTSKAEDKISQLEHELQDIRERYLQISLKYAEVEAQREQLVMKLKAVLWSKNTLQNCISDVRSDPGGRFMVVFLDI